MKKLNLGEDCFCEMKRDKEREQTRLEWQASNPCFGLP